jgi:hypothetical protein
MPAPLNSDSIRQPGRFLGFCDGFLVPGESDLPIESLGKSGQTAKPRPAASCSVMEPDGAQRSSVEALPRGEMYWRSFMQSNIKFRSVPSNLEMKQLNAAFLA